MCVWEGMQAISTLRRRKIWWGFFYVSDNYALDFFASSFSVTLGMHICRYTEGEAPAERYL